MGQFLCLDPEVTPWGNVDGDGGERGKNRQEQPYPETALAHQSLLPPSRVGSITDRFTASARAPHHYNRDRRRGLVVSLFRWH